MVVPICLPSEQAVGSANFKKKSEGPYLGPWVHGSTWKFQINYYGAMDAISCLEIIIICTDIGVI